MLVTDSCGGGMVIIKRIEPPFLRKQAYLMKILFVPSIIKNEEHFNSHVAAMFQGGVL